jgi:hypothetical protein
MIALTHWATPADANEFAGLYAGSLVKRYKTVSESRPLRGGIGEWQTEEGPVEILVSGAYTLAIEGLTAAERAPVRQAIEKTFAEAAPASR